MPVYNVAPYLRECLDSIINQTYKNIEIILVNDGSTDESGAICDEYATMDSRVKVFHNSNHGVSYTRNYGIEQSTCERILFVDSDDTIDTEYVSALVEPLSEYDYDLVVCRYSDVDVIGNLVTERYAKGRLTGDFYTDYYNIELFVMGPIVKLYKKSIFIKQGLQFDCNVSFSEDVVFNIEYCKHVNSYKFIDKALYNYIHHDRISLSRVRSTKNFMSCISEMEKRITFLDEKPIPASDRKLLIGDLITRCVGTFTELSDINNSYSEFCNRVTIVKKVVGSNKYSASTKKRKFVLMSFASGIMYPCYLYYYWKRRLKG